MKIAIPLADGKLALHFGHCRQFALIEANETSKTIQNTTFEEPPAHEPGVLPRWLAENGVNLVIAGGMGQRAQQILASQGIQVMVGAPAENPEAIVAAYFAGTLVTGENTCDH